MGSTRGPTKKKKKTVETQTAVQKEQKHPAAVTTIKLYMFEIFLNYYKT